MLEGGERPHPGKGRSSSALDGLKLSNCNLQYKATYVRSFQIRYAVFLKHGPSHAVKCLGWPAALFFAHQDTNLDTFCFAPVNIWCGNACFEAQLSSKYVLWCSQWVVLDFMCVGSWSVSKRLSRSISLAVYCLSLFTLYALLTLDSCNSSLLAWRTLCIHLCFYKHVSNGFNLLCLRFRSFYFSRNLVWFANRRRSCRVSVTREERNFCMLACPLQRCSRCGNF